MLSARLIQLIETHSQALTRAPCRISPPTHARDRSTWFHGRNSSRARAACTEISESGSAIPGTMPYKRSTRNGAGDGSAREYR
jgi:hypothetical protein